MPPDYSGQNLRGRSFKGQDLTGANFSGADIRGCDFTGANLRGANFSGAKAGLQKRWVIGLVLVSFLLSALSGLFSAFNSFLAVWLIFDSSIESQIGGWVALFILIAFYFITIRQGLTAGLVAIAVAVAITVTVAFAVARVFSFVGAVAAALMLVAAFTFAGAVAFAFAVAVAFAFAGSGVFTVGGAVTVAVGGAGAIAIAAASNFVAAFTFAGAVFFTVGGAEALISIYIAWRAMKGNEKYSLIRNTAIAFAATGGTSFRNANLTKANFTKATLKSTDFRNSILTHTCYHQAKMLDRVCPGKTYLQNSQVRQLLVTRQGQDKNFDYENLRGINLQKANLADTSFIGTDLSEANLQDADLTRAKLKQTQLDATDFTGATLTGAYIEDWGITNDTKFDGVRCEYVYMRVPTRENPNPLRKPDNLQEVFADGEFGDFIKPIFDTLDLYHSQDVDPRAIAISFKELVENHPDAELRIVGMEVRGEDKFLLRAKTAPNADKSTLSAEYFETYNHIKSLPEREIKLLLAEKDNRIRSLENMVVTALQRPSFYAQTYNNQGDTMSERSDNSTYNLNNAKFGGGFAGTAGTTSGGTFYDYSSNPNLAETAAQIQQLLQQLEATNPTATSRKIVNQAIDEIESNPALKTKITTALNSSGAEAFQSAINHPLAKNMMPFLEELAD